MRKSMKPTMSLVTNMSANIPPPHDTRQAADIKPAIASLAGTARLVSMSERPQPPSRHRSERTPSRRKCNIFSEKGTEEKNKIRSTQVQHSTFMTEGYLLTYSSSDRCEEGSEKFKQNVHRKGKSEEGKQLRDMQQEHMPSITRSRSSQCSSALSTICSVKSTSELLEEAKAVTAEDLQQASQQRVPLEPMTEKLAKKRGHVAKKCITSSKSRCKTGNLSSAKQIIKSDMEHIDVPAMKMTDVDVLETRGDRFAPVRRPLKSSQQPKTTSYLSALATWTPTTDSEEYKTIHHLCTTPACHVLPLELQLASRVCHTQDMVMTTPHSDHQRPASRHFPVHPGILRVVHDGIPLEHGGETEQMGGAGPSDAVLSDTLGDWQFCVEKPRMIMCGHAATLCDGQLRMFWNPAPPKFSCAPCVIKDKLFPKYQVALDQPNGGILDNLQNGIESDSDEMDLKQHSVLENVLIRKHMSQIDLTTEKLVPQQSSEIYFQEQLQVRRPFSAPHLTSHSESSLSMQSDFTTVTRELEQARQQQHFSFCAHLDPPLIASHHQPQDAHDRPDSEHPSQELSHRTLPPLHPSDRRVLRHLSMRRRHGKRRGCKGVRRLPQTKMAYVHQKLMEQPQTLSRSQSLCQLKPKMLALRYKSLPLLLDFDSFAVERGAIPDKLPAREWVRNVWHAWFDEIFPLPEESRIMSDQEAMGTDMVSSEQQRSKPADDVTLKGVEKRDPSEMLEDGLIIADLEREVAKLTQTMTEPERISAFDLCRRGALYKKLGLLNQALEDLSAAISLEPHLLDAYWHRHSIFLLRNDPSSALSDLNFIIKCKKNHADAYKSRAEIYRMRGDATLAILNYTLAILHKPEDDEPYFRRAELYEERNEVLLAMEDYAKAFAVNPARTDALMIHGVHCFHTTNWRVALEDFSLLLKQEPGNTKARTYRGRIFAKLGHFQGAIEDFSLAVHLDPSDWLAFYLRGCLLRKIMPDMALRDLSTSVLINDTSENIGALLHRGLIYTDQHQWQQAIADFEAVIKTDRTVAVAHINLGLIYMLKDQNFHAVEMFSNALKVDPTYIKGYVCRARAYQRVNDLVKAVKDLCKAIHMRPDDQQLHIMRGQYLCDMERFDLATFFIQYAAEMNKAIGMSVVQQAAVQSFLGNNAKAIACLEAAADAQPSISTFILLGRIQMKAQRFMEAVDNFRKALSSLSHGDTVFNVLEASELFYFTGMCYMAQGENSLLPQALHAFSNAVKINPEYAEAYYQRGLCHIQLQPSKSVQDFNRALCINPNYFQVYLSLAAFYGGKGQYSKGVQNCNEALRIQPKSVRAYLYRGALKFYLKTYKEAVEDLTMAIQIDKTFNPFAHYNRGVCYQQLQKYNLALQDYKTVLLLSSQKEIELRVLINRALVYVKLNDHSSALKDFKAAVMNQPKDATLHHAVGICYHRIGQLQEAVKAYSEALGLNPFLLDAYVGRANVLMDYGHAMANKQAQRDYLSALHLNPCCSIARIGLAYNFQVCGWFQRAWNQFTVTMEVNPKCWSAYEGRAIVSLQMGDAFAAFQDINNGLKCNPHSDQLLTNRGVINQFMGDKASAMSDYQSAISLNPRCALAFFNAANLFFYNRQYDQAREYYSRAVDLDPSDESAVLNRAITHALLRKIPESLLDFSDALRLNPQSAHVYFNRANLYCSLKKYISAETDLTQALQLQPNDPLLYKLRADVRGHLGLTEQAVQDYRTAMELQDMIQHPKSYLCR